MNKLMNLLFRVIRMYAKRVKKTSTRQLSEKKREDLAKKEPKDALTGLENYLMQHFIQMWELSIR